MAAWNPWRALRSRTHIVFRLAPLPAETGGAIYWPRGSRAAIIIDPALSQVARRAALAHELVHDERGGGADLEGMPGSWSAVVMRDEAAVNAEVARRLVPPAELAEFCRMMVALELPVSALDVAEEFQVPEAVAALAMRAQPK